MGLIVFLLILIFLFGGGGFYAGPPYHYFGRGAEPDTGDRPFGHAVQALTPDALIADTYSAVILARGRLSWRPLSFTGPAHF